MNRIIDVLIYFEWRSIKERFRRRISRFRGEMKKIESSDRGSGEDLQLRRSDERRRRRLSCRSSDLHPTVQMVPRAHLVLFNLIILLILFN